MINFDMSDKLLDELEIYGDKDIFSIMLNYVLNKCCKIYEKDFEEIIKSDLYDIYRKCKDNSKVKNKELTENELKTIKFIDYLYKNVFQYMNISIFLKMNLIYFRERKVKFNNYKLMTDFFDYIFIKYGVNNYMDYLSQYKNFGPEILKFGGEELNEDLNRLFNGLGLNLLFCDRLNNTYAARFTNDVSSHVMFPMPKLSDDDREELKECLAYNKKLCSAFKTSNTDEQQIAAADYMLKRNLNR